MVLLGKGSVERRHHEDEKQYHRHDGTVEGAHSSNLSGTAVVEPENPTVNSKGDIESRFYF